MPNHVFISYKRQDIERARRLRDLLSRTFEVWWDEDLQGGQQWALAIDEALLSAVVVVVLWTPASVASDWVKHEAAVAKSKGTLVPVLLESCDIPAAFAHVHATSLLEWHGDAIALEIMSLCAAVARVKRRRRGRRAVVSAAAVALIALAAGGGLIAGRRVKEVRYAIDLNASDCQMIAVSDRAADAYDCTAPVLQEPCLDYYNDNGNVVALDRLCTLLHSDIACWNAGIARAKGRPNVPVDWQAALASFRHACEYDRDMADGQHVDPRYARVCGATESVQTLKAAPGW